MAEQERFRLRVRYAKRGRLRWLSHKEVMRTIMRVVRRATLPYAVSQGFSPHMKASFSVALSVGCAGEDEYLDVLLTEYIDPARALAALQAATAESMPVLACAYIDDSVPALTAGYPVTAFRAVVDASALAASGAPYSQVQQAALALMQRGWVEVERKGKVKRIELAERLAFGPVALPYEPVEGDGLADEPGLVQVVLATRATETGSLRVDAVLAALAELSGAELPVRFLVHEATAAKFVDGACEGRPL